MKTMEATGFGYPENYAPLTLMNACSALHFYFPIYIRMDGAIRALKNIDRHPDTAESNFAILHWKRLAQSYATATRIMLEKLREKTPFKNACYAKITNKKFRANCRTQTFMEKIWKEQGKNDIVFIGAQLGMRHANRAITEVKNNCDENEFPLDLFSAACILLQCSKRMAWHPRNLWMDCAGSELQSDTGRFDETPTFRFDLPCPRLFAEATEDGPFARVGAATGFVPNYVVDPPTE